MNNVTILLMQMLLSCVVYAIVAVWYVWLSLTKLSRNSALIPLLFVHVMRYLGLTMQQNGLKPDIKGTIAMKLNRSDLVFDALASGARNG